MQRRKHLTHVIRVTCFETSLSSAEVVTVSEAVTEVKLILPSHVCCDRPRRLSLDAVLTGNPSATPSWTAPRCRVHRCCSPASSNEKGTGFSLSRVGPGILPGRISPNPTLRNCRDDPLCLHMDGVDWIECCDPQAAFLTVSAPGATSGAKDEKVSLLRWGCWCRRASSRYLPLSRPDLLQGQPRWARVPSPILFNGICGLFNNQCPELWLPQWVAPGRNFGRHNSDPRYGGLAWYVGSAKTNRNA